MSKKIVGVTGSIGSGKSTVSKHLIQMGYIVIDCDKISHFMLNKNRKGYRQVLAMFGSDVLDELGYIDRKKLGKIIFGNEEKRKMLNNILHPLIREKVKEEINKCDDELIFIDCPLLFETDFHKLCDFKMVVYVDFDTQIHRLMERDKITFPQAINKINAQMPLIEKVKLADVVVDNCHREEDIDWQLTQIIKRFNK